VAEGDKGEEEEVWSIESRQSILSSGQTLERLAGEAVDGECVEAGAGRGQLPPSYRRFSGCVRLSGVGELLRGTSDYSPVLD